MWNDFFGSLWFGGNIVASEALFFAVKLFGATYLLWIAFSLWRSESSPVSKIDDYNTHIGLAKQEFVLAAGNPKAILIFTAFLSQFVDVSAKVNEQFLVLGITFLILEMLAISIYAIFGTYLRYWFSKPRLAKRFNQTCAVFLGFFGLSLLFSRQQ